VKIHEYQGKELLKKFGVPVPRGLVARTAAEAYAAAKELGTDVVVVKAQIHAGGRLFALCRQQYRRSPQAQGRPGQADRSRHQEHL